MKKKFYIPFFVACALLAGACADLGFGVDVDSAGANPYWYGNGYIGSSYWSTPVWNYGPIYNPVPPAPPLIGNGPGSIGVPRPPQRPVPPQQPQIQQRPPQINPGVNGRPTIVGNIQRPGNGGLPNPSNVPTGRPVN